MRRLPHGSAGARSPLRSARRLRNRARDLGAGHADAACAGARRDRLVVRRRRPRRLDAPAREPPRPADGADRDRVVRPRLRLVRLVDSEPRERADAEPLPRSARPPGRRLPVRRRALRPRLRLALLGRLLVEMSGEAIYEDEALRDAAAAARRALGAERPPRELPDLTPRELDVLALIAEGRTDRGIAAVLFVSPKTVEAHVRSIFRKLDLPADSTENRRVHAVLTFLRARTP